MRTDEDGGGTAQLRKVADEAFDALLKLGKAGGPQRVDQTTRRLQGLFPPTALPQQWRRMAIERAVQLYAQASLRVSTGASTEELLRNSRWTVEISHEEIERAREGLRNATYIGEMHELLAATIARNLRFFPVDRPVWEKFHRWFREQADQWLQVAEATDASSDQEQPRECRLRMPLVLPWEEYQSRPLGRLVRSLVRCALGDHASMLTVIEYRGQTPYILYERVEKGEFTRPQLFKGYTKQEVRKCLQAQGEPVAYEKRANIGALIAVWRQHQRYREDGQRCRFLASVLARLARHVQFVPAPPVWAGATRALSDIWIDSSGSQGSSSGGSIVGALSKLDLEGQVPGLEVCVGADRLTVDTGAPYTVSIGDSVVVQLVEALARSRGLASASDRMGEIIVSAVASGRLTGLPRGPLRFFARLAARLAAKRLPPALAAAKWSLRLVGSPLRVGLILGDRIVVLHFLDGNLGRIQLLPAKRAPGPQPRAAPTGRLLSDREQWLALCRNDQVGFVHFLVNPQPVPAESRGPARVGRANRRRAKQAATVRRLRFAERARGPRIYPHHDIAEALLRQFRNLGALKICDFLAGPPL